MSDKVCYAMHAGSIVDVTVDVPCGVTNSTNEHVTCCVQGDYCLSNSLCLHVSDNGDKGYYNADCTDKTLQDPACGTRCGGRPLSDIIWNSNTGHWACCGYNSTTKSPDCSDPSDEIYPGPAPDQLATIQYLPAHGSPTYATGASTATATGTSTATTAVASSSSSGIGAGAAAGIGIGVGAGVVMIAALIALWWLRNRKPAQPQYNPTAFGCNGIPSPAVQPNNLQPGSAYPPVEHFQIQELGKTEPGPRELDSQAR